MKFLLFELSEKSTIIEFCVKIILNKSRRIDYLLSALSLLTSILCCKFYIILISCNTLNITYNMFDRYIFLNYSYFLHYFRYILQ